MRHLFFFIFIIIISCHAVESGNIPKTALVLSGGGARGLAQIGVLKALEEHNFKPDLIVATSMGAIVGALYATGYGADSIAAMARDINWSTIFVNNSKRKTLFVSKKDELTNALFELRFNYEFKPALPNAISYGQTFFDFLSPLLLRHQLEAAADFNNLSIPLRIIATDIISGNKVILSKGNLCNAIRASCAVPLAFTPVEIDSFFLVDGGISSNVPVETARESGAQFIVAIDVTSPPWKKEDLSNPVRLVDQIVAISSLRQRLSAPEQPDIKITPWLFNMKNTDFSLVDSLINSGYRSTKYFLDSLCGSKSMTQYICSQYSAPSEPSDSQNLTNVLSAPKAQEPVISRIVMSGNYRTTAKLIHKASGLKTGDTLTPSAIKKSLSSLYATDLFDNVNIDINNSGTCSIAVKERLYYRMLIGLRYDEFHRGEGYIEPAYENCFGNGTILLLHLQYGLRREKYMFDIKSDQLTSRNVTTNLRFQFYSSKERILEEDMVIIDSATLTSTKELHEHTLRKTGSTFSAGTQLGRSAMLGLDFRIDKFLVQKNDADILNDLFGFDLTKSLPYLSLKLTMDSMDRYPFPTSGMKLFFSLGGTTKAFGQRYEFIKCTGSMGKYTTFFQSHTLFTRLIFSLTDNTLPEIEKAYIGGAIAEETSERISVYNYIPFSGLPPRALTGDMYAIGHFEYRCELKKNFYSIASLDWGPVWGKKDKQSCGSLAENAPFGISIGLAYQTIAGPIRISYGQLLKNSDMYLSQKSIFVYFSAGYDF